MEYKFEIIDDEQNTLNKKFGCFRFLHNKLVGTKEQDIDKKIKDIIDKYDFLKLSLADDLIKQVKDDYVNDCDYLRKKRSMSMRLNVSIEDNSAKIDNVSFNTNNRVVNNGQYLINLTRIPGKENDRFVATISI